MALAHACLLATVTRRFTLPQHVSSCRYYHTARSRKTHTTISFFSILLERKKERHVTLTATQKAALILIGVCFRLSRPLARFPWIEYSKYSYPFAALMHATQCYLPLPVRLSVYYLISLTDDIFRSKMRWNGKHWPPHYPRTHTQTHTVPSLRVKLCACINVALHVYPNPLRLQLFP